MNTTASKVDHGFVVHRQQLLGNGQCDGVQARAGTACEDDAFSGVLGHNCFQFFV